MDIKLYRAVTVNDDDTITVHMSMQPITEKTFQKSPLSAPYADRPVYPIPDDKEVDNGRHINEYDGEWNLKPLSWRVMEGYASISENVYLDGEEVKEVPEGYAREGFGIREMTEDEKIEVGLIVPVREETIEEVLSFSEIEAKEVPLPTVEELRAQLWQAQIIMDKLKEQITDLAGPETEDEL